ncbi:hypothetical protein MGG_07804 [Pyricularia oryzae 70-15]|uniref:Uncharacterized protein n=3 Tax=Pyricularia oryzae TaxID=318829 RepID=G4N139_PYRO7|nr:uncharacterized protein MGG_07804 [Pyricularia oryzae 70-15]EHA53215.1 hypothetical protein MGG_07804 [Pyricularia oryzae 70-15]ELQ32766.1 hypothetical protein OOU_Y34scaffold01044g1 [Pyricularia oryzae Y34]KAI7908953.1 hypothetical protein M9X92_011910 [Pyricularia oryzae]KAI7909082.1 hypothetical protein M0657_011997 [Pyricularia oryzae]
MHFTTLLGTTIALLAGQCAAASPSTPASYSAEAAAAAALGPLTRIDKPFTQCRITYTAPNKKPVVNKLGHGGTAKLSVDGVTYTAVADAKCKLVVVGSPWPAGHFTVGQVVKGKVGVPPRMEIWVDEEDIVPKMSRLGLGRRPGRARHGQ